MNLPFVVDIAIGLVFMYLILSLLASEIQELITTLLQWRAEHLKNSIEIMLASGQVSPNAKEIKSLTDKLYHHPLISSLNQEAKGRLALGFRKFANFFISLYYRLTGSENPFKNDSSGPSYIPAEAFATTLIDTFKLKEIGQAVTLARLEDFKQQQIKDILKTLKAIELSDSARSIVTQELESVEQDWQGIINDFGTRRVNLPKSLDRMNQRLEIFVSNCQNYIEQPETYLNAFIYRVQHLQDKNYSETERSVLIQSLKPSMNEVVEMIQNKPKMYSELQRAIEDKNSPSHQGISDVIESLPELPAPVKHSLAALGTRIQSQKESIEDEVSELQLQIESWFDASMTRSSGVYKRNARGIAVLIGIIVAVATNADSLYITESLSKNSVLRAAITENAGQFVARDSQPTSADFKKLSQEVKESLDEASLPLGWRANLVTEQALENKGWPLPYLKRLVGWAISGLAISMGASFWYDLLGKVVNVRNSGSRSSSRS
ncbi:hypothetical protein IQ235_07060 [Oscillatoriales cyanobacterium LEGE 11467]|uniref:Uncharacterized protein n=1 Tax=Zarconia navalis LEGE 11467 TaxID=1828826 RepID=A0A928VVZ7_9CYAN|nr:hypothetical protein [Zarconia navalis]MBE9040544.1 hypothetical protein [Zarconia navalis LEGE 11467]